MINLVERIRIKQKSRQRGQSIVEFALLAPVLIILFMGMFDFGWILHQQIQMDNSTRLGARRGAVGDTNTEIMKAILDGVTYPLNETDITIEVFDPYGVVVADSENRTPDNTIVVGIKRDNVQLITPLANFVESLTPINLSSEGNFLIE
ncbi:pilus assembly protein [bacterium]|nr:pilus assembly protein [bacterium]